MNTSLQMVTTYRIVFNKSKKLFFPEDQIGKGDENRKRKQFQKLNLYSIYDTESWRGGNREKEMREKFNICINRVIAITRRWQGDVGQKTMSSGQIDRAEDAVNNNDGDEKKHNKKEDNEKVEEKGDEDGVEIDQQVMLTGRRTKDEDQVIEKGKKAKEEQKSWKEISGKRTSSQTSAMK